MKQLIAFTLLAFVFSFAQAQKKVSQLPIATDLINSYVPIIQDSSGSYVNRKFPGNSFRTPLVSNGLSLDGDTVKLGGVISQSTTITGIDLENNDILDITMPNVYVYGTNGLALTGYETDIQGTSLLNMTSANTILTTEDFVITSVLDVERFNINSAGDFFLENPTTKIYNEVVGDAYILTAISRNVDQDRFAQLMLYSDPTTINAVLEANDELGNSSNIAIHPDFFTVNINTDTGSTGEYLGSDGAGSVVWGTPSDERLKKDISPLQSASEKILSLKPVNFTYKKGNQKSVGFIAQDVEKVIPEMVTEKGGYKHLKNVTYLEPFIISTIQDLQAQITALQKEVEQLKKKPRRARR